MPPDVPDRMDEELLGRYLAGECSEAETAAVRRYLMARPRAARALGQFLASLDGTGSRPDGSDEGDPQAPNTTASWLALRARLLPAATPVGSAPPAVVRPTRAVPPRRWRPPSLLVTAAAAAAVVAMSYGSTHHRWPMGGRSDVASVAPRTYGTGPGERAELRLSDGTRVRLAPASRLRVSADYGTDRRDVSLEGEGFFDVAHDARRPFTVFAGNASAHDLGTAFAVRSYAGDGAVQVVVRAGQVALSGVGRLAPGDVGRLTSDGRPSVRHGVDVDAVLGWLDGTLVFQDAPLGQVLEDLERWYQVDARLSDPTLAALPFTGTFDAPDPERAVRLVAATLSLRVRHDGTRFVLAPTPGRTPRAPAPRSAASAARP